MKDLIIIAIVLVIICIAAGYVYRAKKRGKSCIGCPHSKTCSEKNCSCGDNK